MKSEEFKIGNKVNIKGKKGVYRINGVNPLTVEVFINGFAFSSKVKSEDLKLTDKQRTFKNENFVSKRFKNYTP